MRAQFTADDWGLSREINRGILELAKQKKLATVSILINGPELNYLLSDLLQTNIDLSLHLNLTEGSPLGSGYKMIADSNNLFKGILFYFRFHYFSQILKNEMAAEAQLQIAKAKSIFTNRLNELDGHHHIHLYPGLLSKLYSSLVDNNIKKIRIPLDKSHLGSASLGWILNQQKYKFPNLEFLPYGYFSPTQNLDKKFNNYLCHPALSEVPGDPMKMRRVKEFARLAEL